jgi:RHS repeat-associated protein
MERLERRLLFTTYAIHDLGTLGGTTSSASAIDASGDVVGTAATNSDSANHAVVWFNGQAAQDLGTFGGTNSQATGINSFGEVVGNADNGSGGSDAFSWQQGQNLTDMTTLENGEILTAQAVNDDGVVTGSAVFPIIDTAGVEDGYALNATFQGNFIELGNIHSTGGSADYFGVSSTSAVGTFVDINNFTHGVIADLAHSGSAQELPGLASRLSLNNEALAIATSADGQTQYVVGDEQVLVRSGLGFVAIGEGVLWTVTSSGISAVAFNSSGNVVGRAVNGLRQAVGEDVGASHAVVWDSTNGLVDLNALIPQGTGWQLTNATGINDQGEICGTGTINGQQHAFLLTPITSPPGAVLITAPDVSDPGGTNYGLSVQYSDDNEISASTLGDANVLVTNARGYSQLATLSQPAGPDDTSILASYNIAPPGGSWDYTDNGTYTITLEPNQVANTQGNYIPSGILGHFVVHIPKPRGNIGGTLYVDTSGSGVRQPADPTFPGEAAVYLDLNNNGQLDAGEPTVTTASDGTYAFDGLLPGTYYVREVTPFGYTQTEPTGGTYTVTIAGGDAHLGLDFGNEPNGGIIGQVQYEIANNATVPAPGWEVYIDFANDGHLDPGDPVAITDSQGNYELPITNTGVYTVRVVQQQDCVLLTPTSGFDTVVVNNLSAPMTFGASFLEQHLPPQTSSRFQVTDLGAYPAVTIYGIDNHNNVVGTRVVNGQQQAFIYNYGAFRPISAFGGVALTANAIDDAGEVAGTAVDPNGVTAPFVEDLTTGRIQELTFDAGTTATPIRINDKGQVLVSEKSGSGSNAIYGGYVYDFRNPQYYPLSQSGQSTVLAGLNNSGEVFGSGVAPNGQSNVTFVYNINDGSITTTPQVIKGQGEAAIVPIAINNKHERLAEDVVLSIITITYGFLAPIDPNLQPTWWTVQPVLPLSVNDLNHIVGTSIGAKSIALERAFYGYTDGSSQSQVIGLNQVIDPVTGAGWTLNEADLINNNDVIAGVGTVNGQLHVFELSYPPPPENINRTYVDGVDVANGNVHIQQADINLPGIGLPLDFNRTYDSLNTADVGMGQGWSFSYSDNLSFYSAGILWNDGSGHHYLFRSNGDGTFSNPTGLFGTFSALGNGFTFRTTTGAVYTFSFGGQLLSIKDRNGNEQDLTYTGSLLTSVFDKNHPERTLTFAYDSTNHLTSVTDFTGRTWTYSYTTDSTGESPIALLSQVTSPSDSVTSAAVTSFTYNANNSSAPPGEGMMSSWTDADGNTTKYYYNLPGIVNTVIDPTGAFTTYTYNSILDQTTVADGRDISTTYKYDALGQRIQIMYADGTTDKFTWNNGLLSSHTDGRGKTTIYTYDSRGNLIQTIAPIGIIKATYDPTFSQPLTTTDADGNTTTYGYDSHGNLISIRDPQGHVTTLSYNSDGTLASRTMPKGQSSIVLIADGFTTVYDYNSAGQVIEQGSDINVATGNPLINTTFAYDARGNLISVTDPDIHTTTYTYDLLGRQLTVTDAVSNTTQMTYDDLGLLLARTTARGEETDYVYDGDRRLIQVINADRHIFPAGFVPTGNFVKFLAFIGGHTVTEWASAVNYSYDLDGNLASTTDENGNVTQYSYDNRNRRVQTIDPLGNTTTITYDGDGDLISTTDARKNTTTYSYDPDNRLLTKVDALGDVTTRTYDAAGNLTSLTDPNGNKTRYIYDSLNRKIESINPLGQMSLTTYDADGNVISVTDFRGAQTKFQYDFLDRQTTATDPLTASTTMVLDGAGNVVKTIDPLGNASVNTYDADNRLISTTDPLGNTTTTTYDADGNIASVTDALHRTTNFRYDNRERQISVTDALGKTTTTAYDEDGNILSVSDPLGRITSYKYDADNRRTSVTDPTSAQTITAYDAVGNAVSVTDANQHATRFTYDAANRRVTNTDALLNVTTTTYDRNGNVTSITDPLHHATLFAYDALNRRTSSTDALGQTTRIAYDADGNVISVTDPLSRVTKYSYDADNRKITTTDPLLNVTTMSYNADGSLTAITDPLGHKTTDGYDTDQRRITVTDALNHTTTTTYDTVGNVSSVTDPGGNKTTYAYDADNRKTADTDILGNTETFSYDAAGQLTSHKDRDGQVITYGYDGDGRIVQEIWLSAANQPIRTIIHQYDPGGRLISESDPAATYIYSYDNDNRLTIVDNAGTPNAPHSVLTYGYDAAGNVTSLSDTLNGTADAVRNYTYDTDNRLTRLTQTGGASSAERVDFSYDAASELTGTLRYSNVAGTGTSAATRDTYDTDGRMLSQVNTFGTTALGTDSWTYDAAGRVITQVTPDGTDRYTYDAANQETAVTHTGAAGESYSYDSNGNRTSTGYSTGKNNQLLSDGQNTYAYDANGNRISRTNIQTKVVTLYTYDYRNRLIEIIQKSSAGAVTSDIKYTYDANDNRIATGNSAGTGTPVVADYVYDGQNVLLQSSGNTGALTHLYLNGVGVDVHLSDSVIGSGVSWLLQDRQGTVRDVVSTAGRILDHIQYNSFGSVTNESNATAASIFGYTGQQRDQGTGLYYYRARFYDPYTGKFLSLDPFELNTGDPNPYRYVMNSPANFTDPQGTVPMIPLNIPTRIMPFDSGAVDLVGSLNASPIGAAIYRAASNLSVPVVVITSALDEDFFPLNRSFVTRSAQFPTLDAVVISAQEVQYWYGKWGIEDSTTAALAHELGHLLFGSNQNYAITAENWVRTDLGLTARQLDADKAVVPQASNNWATNLGLPQLSLDFPQSLPSGNAPSDYQFGLRLNPLNPDFVGVDASKFNLGNFAGDLTLDTDAAGTLGDTALVPGNPFGLNLNGAEGVPFGLNLGIEPQIISPSPLNLNLPSNAVPATEPSLFDAVPNPGGSLGGEAGGQSFLSNLGLNFTLQLGDFGVNGSTSDIGSWFSSPSPPAGDDQSSFSFGPATAGPADAQVPGADYSGGLSGAF